MNRSLLQRWLPKVALLAFTLLLLELMLHGVAHFSRDVAYVLAQPWERDIPVVADGLEGFIGNPIKRDHDRDGYRNAVIPPKANVVVFGDSQCYGIGVTREEAWPSVLARISALTVYNMALPGHGPANAALLIERALRLEPRYVLAGVYFGNDLYDGFALARANPATGRFVPPDLEREAEERERASPLTFGFDALFAGAGDANAPEQEVGPLRRLLSDYSALYGILRSLRARFQDSRGAGVLGRDFQTAVSALDGTRLEWFSPFESRDGWRTILTGRYRARVMDLEDPRLAAGLEAGVGALVAVDRAARVANAQLIVVLIPTKEFVFAPRVSDPQSHVGLVDLLERETALRSTLTARLERVGIPVLDLAPPLRAQVESPYFEDADGHPNPRGHSVIARAVRERLEAPGVPH